VSKAKRHTVDLEDVEITGADGSMRALIQWKSKATMSKTFWDRFEAKTGISRDGLEARLAHEVMPLLFDQIAAELDELRKAALAEDME
jgi:hypothetical protein